MFIFTQYYIILAQINYFIFSVRMLKNSPLEFYIASNTHAQLQCVGAAPTLF